MFQLFNYSSDPSTWCMTSGSPLPTRGKCSSHEPRESTATYGQLLCAVQLLALLRVPAPQGCVRALLQASEWHQAPTLCTIIWGTVPRSGVSGAKRTRKRMRGLRGSWVPQGAILWKEVSPRLLLQQQRTPFLWGPNVGGPYGAGWTPALRCWPLDSRGSAPEQHRLGIWSRKCWFTTFGVSPGWIQNCSPHTGLFDKQGHFGTRLVDFCRKYFLSTIRVFVFLCYTFPYFY